VAARQYAQAAARGDADQLYEMLATPSRHAISREDARRLIGAERLELAQRGRELSGNELRVSATAQMRFSDGEGAALDLQGSRFAVTSAGGLPGGGRTPEEALGQLRRVLARRSYSALMRVLSSGTRATVEDDMRSLVKGLSDPGALPAQVSGDEAVVPVPGGHLVKLKREAGVWRVENFD
jgi:hypothetical protein